MVVEENAKTIISSLAPPGKVISSQQEMQLQQVRKLAKILKRNATSASSVLGVVVTAIVGLLRVPSRLLVLNAAESNS